METAQLRPAVWSDVSSRLSHEHAFMDRISGNPPVAERFRAAIALVDGAQQGIAAAGIEEVTPIGDGSSWRRVVGYGLRGRSWKACENGKGAISWRGSTADGSAPIPPADDCPVHPHKCPCATRSNRMYRAGISGNAMAVYKILYILKCVNRVLASIRRHGATDRRGISKGSAELPVLALPDTIQPGPAAEGIKLAGATSSPRRFDAAAPRRAPVPGPTKPPASRSSQGKRGNGGRTRART